MRVLIINAQDIRRAPYHDWLADEGHELILLTTREAFKGMPLQARRHYARIIPLVQFRDPKAFDPVLAKLCRTQEIDQVVALSEFDVGRAARLRDRLGLVGQGWGSAKYFRDKLLMKQALQDAGVPVPRFSKVSSQDEAARFVSDLDKQAVLKLRRGAGSLGIWQAASTAEARILADRVEVSRFPRRWMMEEYIDGELFHVDGVVLNQVPTFISCAAYLEPPLAFSAGRPGGSFLLDTNSPDHRALEEFAKRCLAALPIPEHMAFHLDVFRTGDGRLLAGEVACRAAGNRIKDMIWSAYGVDLELVAVRAQLGAEVSLPEPSPATCAGWGAIRRRAGLLSQRLPPSPFDWMTSARLHPRVGERMQDARSSIDNLWSFVATASSSDEVRQRIVTGLEWGRAALASRIDVDKSAAG